MTTYFASPGGSPSGAGTAASPWDLDTALRSSGNPGGTIDPGDTLFLRGGVYTGVFVSNLAGSAGSPITVRSFPGEQAILDGNFDTTLSASINASVETIQLATNKIRSGTTVRVENEDIVIASGPSGGGPYSYSCTRGWNGTTAASHTSGIAVKVKGSVLLDSGSYTIWWGLEIRDSDLQRQIPDPSYQGFRGDGLELRGAYTKVVHCLIHDTLNGVGFWVQAEDSELVGCVVVNSGYLHAGGNGGGGHGLYCENHEPSHKLVRDCVFMNAFGYPLHCFAVSAYVENLTLDGIMVSGGGACTVAQGGPARPTAHIGADSNPASGILLKNSAFFDPPRSGAGVTLGYAGVVEEDIVVTDCVFDAGHMEVSEWQDITFRRNVATETFSSIETARYVFFTDTPVGVAAPLTDDYDWDQNTYFTEAAEVFAWRFGGGSSSVGTFAQWKTATGLDGASTRSAGRPTGTKVIVRPSPYVRGRIHAAIFNWDEASSVLVPIGDALRPGDAYRVTLVERYNQAPIATGIYAGGSIAVPMTSPGATTGPVGTGMSAVPTTLPEYGVVVIERING